MVPGTNKERTGGKRTSENKQVGISDQFIVNPSNSSRTVSRECGLTYRNVLKILHQTKFHRYKTKILHELTGDDAFIMLF